MIDAETTLGDVVTEHPHLARALERRGLDYCCGGRRTISEACASLGLDPEVVAGELAALRAPTATAPWATMSVAELVDHIEAVHHHYLHDELRRLTALLDKVVDVHAVRHPELVEVAALFAELRADLEPHLTKEERILFPMIRELSRSETRPTFHCGRIANPISMMMLEHDRAGELLTRLRTTATGYQPPADACASYRACLDGLAALEADTHLHVHKENNLLFPAVVDLEEQRSVSQSGGARR